jgi:hypothetical protein
MKNSVQNVERALIEAAAVRVGGVFEADCYDQHGNLKWKDIAKNLVVNAGLDHILDVIFHGSTQVNPWYGHNNETAPEPLEVLGLINTRKIKLVHRVDGYNIYRVL